MFYFDQDNSQNSMMALEMQFIQQYLGCPLSHLKDMEPNHASRLMREACIRATLQLEEIKARGRWVHDLRGLCDSCG